MTIRLLTALLALWPGHAALAQEQNPLEEVVVSGYRRAPARELGLSLSVLQARDIERAAISHLEELFPLVPNFNQSGEGSRARYLQIRGVGEREQYEGAPNPSVGFYIDDIDLSGISGVAGVFDLGSVEVLRGPQSARFGGSALAGVVYATSTDPRQDAGMRVSLSAGGDAFRSAGVVVGGQLSPGIWGRLSAYGDRSDGFRDNEWTASPTNRRKERIVHGKLAWDTDGDWEALLALLYADNDNGYDAWTVRNDATTHSDQPGRDEQTTLGGSLRLQRSNAGGGQFQSITAISHSDILFSFDGDWGNEAFWREYGGYVYDYRYRNPRTRDSLAQEFRLVSAPGAIGGHTDWVVGAFWRQLDEDNRIDSTGVYDDRMEENYCAPCLTDRQVDSAFTSRNLALFAATESSLGADWSLSLGVRMEQWRARYADDWADVNYPGPPGDSSCAQFDCAPDDTLWGGHVALARELGTSTRVYLRLARGFKAGGFNPSLAALQGVAQLGPEFVAYGDEAITNLELGFKGSWLNGRLAGDLAVFSMHRRDAQLSQSSQQVAFDPNSFVFVTYNGDADVRGLEASAQWRASPAWRLHASLGLLDSEILDTSATRLVSPLAVNRDLAHAPRYTASLGASFEHPDGWFARIDASAMDRFYFDISHDQRSGERRLINLRLGRRWGDWTASAWVRNLTDERYSTRGFYFGNEPPGFEPTLYTRFGDPRQVGLSLDYRRVDD